MLIIMVVFSHWKYHYVRTLYVVITLGSKIFIEVHGSFNLKTESYVKE